MNIESHKSTNSTKTICAGSSNPFLLIEPGDYGVLGHNECTDVTGILSRSAEVQRLSNPKLNNESLVLIASTLAATFNGLSQ